MIVLAIFALAVTIGLIALLRFRQTNFEIFDALLLYLVAYFMIYCVQMYSVRDFVTMRFGGSGFVLFGIFIAWAALLIFTMGYFSKLSSKLALRVPRPPANWTPGMLCPVGVFLALLGFAGMAIFIRQSGGMEEYYSESRGKGAYEQSTAYIWGAKYYLIPAIVILLTETGRMRRIGPWHFIAWFVSGFYFLYSVWIGQRSGVVSAGIIIVTSWYVPRHNRVPRKVAVAGGVVMMVLFSFLAIFRSELYWGSDFARIKQLRQMNAEQIAELMVTGIVGIRERNFSDSLEAPMYLHYLNLFPEQLPPDLGQYYLQYFVQWIPRIFWPDRPDFRLKWTYMVYSTIGVAHGQGPCPTILGMYNMHGGLIGLLGLSYLTGLIFGWYYKWHRTWPGNVSVQMLYSMFLWMPLQVVPGVGLFANWDTLGFFVLAPMLATFAYLRFRLGPKDRRQPVWEGPVGGPGTAIPSAPVAPQPLITLQRQRGGGVPFRPVMR
ncbi:MAG TPA: hypothetical protein PL033_17815 [Candidatus Brocadiia bacterium]|nr:hypothetical protein [Candidatus Brocadiia bacterium]